MTLPLSTLILPAWLYHATQGGKIFRTREDLDEAHAQGWRDSPCAALAASIGMTVTESRSDDYAADVKSLPVIKAPIVEVQKVIAMKRKR